MWKIEIGNIIVHTNKYIKNVFFLLPFENDFQNDDDDDDDDIVSWLNCFRKVTCYNSPVSGEWVQQPSSHFSHVANVVKSFFLLLLYLYVYTPFTYTYE